MTKSSNRDVAAFAGYLEEDALLLKSTSGGVATALALHMIERGGYVAGVAYRQDWQGAEYILTNRIEDIERLKGSKYIESEKNMIYQRVKELLDSDVPVLFIGLPCTVAALHRFLGTEQKHLITCELICHGPTSPKVHQEYIAHLEQRFQSSVVDFSVRHKDGRWLPTYLYARFENGAQFQKEFYSTEYGYAFSVLGRPSCYYCPFKGDGRTGDLMVGDFWGASESDPFWNEKGVSAILVETEKGLDFLQTTSGLKLFPTTFERIVTGNPRVLSSKPKSSDYDRFSKLFSEKGLLYAAHHAPSISHRLKTVLKDHLPSSAVAMIRKAYHAIRR